MQRVIDWCAIDRQDDFIRPRGTAAESDQNDDLQDQKKSIQGWLLQGRIKQT